MYPMPAPRTHFFCYFLLFLLFAFFFAICFSLQHAGTIAEKETQAGGYIEKARKGSQEQAVLAARLILRAADHEVVERVLVPVIGVRHNLVHPLLLCRCRTLSDSESRGSGSSPVVD